MTPRVLGTLRSHEHLRRWELSPGGKHTRQTHRTNRFCEVLYVFTEFFLSLRADIWGGAGTTRGRKYVYKYSVSRGLEYEFGGTPADTLKC